MAEPSSQTQVAKLLVGDAEVWRVVEWLGPLAPVEQLFPDTPASVWTDEAGWLVPRYLTESGAYRAAIQTWVLRTDGLTVLVDTGVGNGRDRPQAPAFDHLQTPFFEGLEKAGLEAGSIDVVVNTHIHYDHVGWNTRRHADGWVPSFPNATYLVPRADYEYFHPDHAQGMREARTTDEERRFAGASVVFADSIAPLEAAGQLQTWETSRSVTKNLQLLPSPGHTPGSSVAWLAGGPGAAFVGDLMHSPVQALRPDDGCAFDLDPAMARRSRRDVLGRAASSGALVLPAHLAGHGGLFLTTSEPNRPPRGGFAISRWADLSEV